MVLKGTLWSPLWRQFKKDAGKHVGYVELVVPLRIDLKDFAVIDLETWSFKRDLSSIVTYGIVYRDSLLILQRTSKGPGFDDRLAEIHSRVVADGVDLCAFNKSFEASYLKGFGGTWHEIWPSKMKKDECIHFSHFSYGAGDECTDWWKSFGSDGDRKWLWKIVKHNTTCLIKETAIVMTKDQICDLGKGTGKTKLPGSNWLPKAGKGNKE